jgi:hypothetical protein
MGGLSKIRDASFCMRTESKFYRAVRALLVGLPLTTHERARLARAAIVVGLAMIDGRGRAYLIPRSNRNTDVSL